MTLMLLLAAGLLTGCSSDDSDDVPATDPDNGTGEAGTEEIRVKADIWQMMQGGTRAATYDDQSALQTLGSFNCAVYVADATTEYISTTQVDWNSTSSVWEFNDGKHYWPLSESLDFFAYLPATLPGYITTGPTYTVDAPSFVCEDLPISFTQGSDATTEFLMAFTPGQNKTDQGATGVTMTFLHPFARVCFKLSSASGSAVTVNSITIGGSIYRNGTCTLNDNGAGSQTIAWSSLSNTGNLVITGSPATDDDDFYLVIPYDYGYQTLTVNATWDEWGDGVTADVSASVDFDWTAGYSYTYTLTLSEYALTVSTTTYTEQW